MKYDNSSYSLRYQVYCHEAKFLNPDNYTVGLEFDEFDIVSEHFVATNPKNDNDVVGTVRLVKWSENLSFPTANYMRSLNKHLKALKFPLDSTAEVSRLCITKRYRRDGLVSANSLMDRKNQHHEYPVVILELFKNMYLASRYALGITHWIATFEDSLHRLLKIYGVDLKLLIPDEIDYCGKVKLYGASIEHVETEMKRRKPEFYAFFCAQSDQT
jgi:N-acyl amino acid synthase of PEP-CTERM/exosortase system